MPRVAPPLLRGIIILCIFRQLPTFSFRHAEPLANLGVNSSEASFLRLRTGSLGKLGMTEADRILRFCLGMTTEKAVIPSVREESSLRLRTGSLALLGMTERVSPSSNYWS